MITTQQGVSDTLNSKYVKTSNINRIAIIILHTVTNAPVQRTNDRHDTRTTLIKNPIMAPMDSNTCVSNAHNTLQYVCVRCRCTMSIQFACDEDEQIKSHNRDAFHSSNQFHYSVNVTSSASYDFAVYKISICHSSEAADSSLPLPLPPPLSLLLLTSLWFWFFFYPFHRMDQQRARKCINTT